MTDISKGMGIRERLVNLIYDQEPRSVEERSALVLFVSKKDTDEFEDALVKGFLGDLLQQEFLVKGVYGTFPVFVGVTTIWNSETTAVSKIDALSKEDLLLVVQGQRRHIKSLYEHRQRL